MQQPPAEPPYGLQRPPFPPPVPAPFVEPAPILPVLQPVAAVPVDRRARTAGIVLLVSSAAMLAGIISFSWFTKGSNGIGLAGVKECFERGCHTAMWTDLKRAPSDLALFGYVGMLAMMASIALSSHAGIMLLGQQPARVKLTAVNVTLGIAAFAAVSFWMRVAFGSFGHRLSYGWAGFVAIAGVLAAGTVIHRVVRKLHHP